MVVAFGDAGGGCDGSPRVRCGAGLRGFLVVAVRVGDRRQVGAGIVVIASKVALRCCAQGQVAGSRSRRRRAPRLRRAGTCRSR